MLFRFGGRAGCFDACVALCCSLSSCFLFVCLCWHLVRVVSLASMGFVLGSIGGERGVIIWGLV